MKKLLGFVMIFTTLFFTQNDTAAQTRERSEIPEKYKWDLTDLYESDQSWKEAKEELASRVDEITQFKGKLSTSAEMLLNCLQLNTELSKKYTQLYVYAARTSDLDTRVSKYQAMKQELDQLGTQFNSKSSFIEPEILSMESEKINDFLNKEPELDVYRFYLKDLQRIKAHRLSAEEEELLAHAGLMAGSPGHIYSILSNADLPYPDITLSDGTETTLNAAAFTKYRASKNREDRERVFNKFFGILKDFRNTFGASLSGQINTDVFFTRARNYETSLKAALDDNNIPTDVYMSLINNVKDNLNSFHRYLKIKKRMLGVDTLKYSDMYAPTVEDVDLDYEIGEAYDIVRDALQPLGTDYMSTLEKALTERWIDVYPTPGKTSGAYSSGSAYDVHPYILLNFNGAYNDVSTLAHELGHTMHSYYSNENQPYPLSHYSIFVAEVASTFNEALLTDYMLDRVKDDDTRLSLLMEYLDRLKGTVFRQTHFAEFELKIHQLAEEGKALTGESLTKLYGEIVRNYYGHDEGVCHIDDLYTHEWAYIPHFYYNFYVYQYSTSFCASTALAEQVLNKEPGSRDRFIAFLSSGGSDYPINLLKDAGVDMTTAEPFNKTMNKMNRIMDEIEKILDKKGL